MLRERAELERQEQKLVRHAPVGQTCEPRTMILTGWIYCAAWNRGASARSGQILDIKKAAKNGQDKSAKILAKELVRLRSQKDKLTSMHAQVGSVSVRATVRA